MRSALVTFLYCFLAGLAAGQEAKPDPSKAEVPLPALNGWAGTLVYESDVGIWTCGTCKAFPMYGCPEVFALDDKGRCTILMSYSGKWTPYQTVEDREWLGAFANLDLDPRRPGTEMYTGGKPGNLYQIQAHPSGGFDTQLIARFPAQEIHTLVGGDLLPERPGNELIAFTLLGQVYDIQPRKESGNEFDAKRIDDLGMRVRQALVLPTQGKEAPWIACACRAGNVTLIRMNDEGLEHRVIAERPMGFGRLARRASAANILYATCDDGVVLRLEQKSADQWTQSIIYVGPQGPRGIAAGRFNADPNVETVAVFGYSKRVQLLTRSAEGAWTVEDIFEERDKGHWLEAVELDGRNGTDELLASGYGTRCILLSRPPGYGLKGVAIDPGPKAEAPKDTLRIGMRAKKGTGKELSTLSYRGGFETKSLVYETLVRRDEEGHIVPGLASSWHVENGGKRLLLELREGAKFHDGAPVDAESVKLHFQRWVGLPEHGWLGANAHVRGMTVKSPRELLIDLDEPYALLPDLCAINPCGVRAPGALDREGNFVRPVGSGDYRYVGMSDDGGVLHYECSTATVASQSPLLIDLVLFDSDAPSKPLDAFLADQLDLLIDGWYEMVPRARLSTLQSDGRIRVLEGPGSSVIYLSFRLSGPTQEAGLRTRLRGAIDRRELVDLVETGRADACTTFAAPTVRYWPRSNATSLTFTGTSIGTDSPLRILTSNANEREAPLARALIQQWARAGIAATLEQADAAGYRSAVDRGDYDVRFERTLGVPYDPDISLASRFLKPSARASAASSPRSPIDHRMSALVAEASRCAEEADRIAVYQQIQDLIDQQALIIPLYVPRRLAVVRNGAPTPKLDHDLYHLRWEKD